MGRTWRAGRHRRDVCQFAKHGKRALLAMYHADPKCWTGKRCYLTRHVADAMQRELQRLRGRHRNAKCEHHAYRCPHCGYWHLTSQKPRS